MPNLAEYYQTSAINNFAIESSVLQGDIFKLEQFKYTYERFKLKMAYSNEEVTQHELLESTRKNADSPDFAPWQQAELLRIIGEHYLAKGKIP